MYNMIREGLKAIFFFSGRSLTQAFQYVKILELIKSSFCFSFWGHTQGILKLPGQRLNWSQSCQPTTQLQQCQIQAASVTYTTALSNAGYFNPLSKARGQIHIFMDTSLVLNPLSHNWRLFTQRVSAYMLVAYLLNKLILFLFGSILIKLDT